MLTAPELGRTTSSNLKVKTKMLRIPVTESP